MYYNYIIYLIRIFILNLKHSGRPLLELFGVAFVASSHPTQADGPDHARGVRRVVVVSEHVPGYMDTRLSSSTLPPCPMYHFRYTSK